MQQLSYFYPQNMYVKCPLWLGANNWDPTGGPNEVYFASTGADMSPPFYVSDESDSLTENCVTLEGSTTTFTDHNCECSYFNFVCQQIIEDNGGGSGGGGCDQPDLMPDDIQVADGKCDVEYEPVNCTDECSGDRCECLGDQHNNIVYEWEFNDGTGKFKEIRTVTTECLNWVEAQKFCCEVYGGKLWEPRDVMEFTTAWTAITNNVSHTFSFKWARKLIPQQVY